MMWWIQSFFCDHSPKQVKEGFIVRACSGLTGGAKLGTYKTYRCTQCGCTKTERDMW